MRLGDVRANDQKNQAIALMEQAECDITQACGYAEWTKLQQVLAPQYRLKIFQFKSTSTKLTLERIFKGWGDGTCLNILLDDHHYDAILSMPGVTGNQYYCDHCDVGYRKVTDHRSKCPHRCTYCLGQHPQCPDEGIKIKCQECHGMFKNRTCYENHLRPHSKKTTTTVCNLMGLCEKCHSWIPKKLFPHHKCGGQKQCKISKMPSAFGFDELKKGYFPHFFNTEQNQNYVGPYPPAAFYNPDEMSISGRRAFFEWYEQQRGKVFDFQKEFVEYCVSDVDILRRCCAKFRATLKSLVNVDPFQESITFASAANLAYRRQFMPEDTIAIIPNLGYQPARQYSAKACRWLTWMSQQTGCHIQHARNGGEVQIGNYTVDGYQEATRTVYEFYGCYWHGCPTCYPSLQTETHPHRTQYTYQQLHEETLRRTLTLEDMGYTVRGIWEHDFDQQVQKDVSLQQFVGNLDIPDPLKPREALYGGRTNATRLYCEEGDMRYVDVCSLYPYVLKHRPFPVGHPEIITDEFQDVRNYFGLIHCRVLPPRDLYHPVLPYRTGGKLLFPLCRTCAERQDSTSQDRCQHTDQERSLTGTWVTTELHKALDMGYTLDRIYEVWHFKESSQELFRSYIDTFLKIKQEASGFPPDCKTSEQEQDYIRQVLYKEGFMMDILSIEKNPVRRTIAKLFLNCLWGKFAQRLLLPKTRYLDEEEELQQLLQDSTLDIKGMQLLDNKEDSNKDKMLVNYQDKQEFVEECPFGNVVLACFTTAHARLHLYETLQPLGDRVLYFDTDSIIYQHREGAFNPTLGNSLGEWTDELDGDHIIKFMSAGPKNYGYRTAKGTEVHKVKGITLNYRTSQIVSLETLEKMLKGEIEEVTVPYPNKIQRTRDHEVVNKPLEKKYRIVYDKRQLLPSYNTLPYGY
ncbi:uncharacterized protein LOC134237107 [Saccostrea cucullata]|uniref:uncharacterized protein LOC134237107 n=1 Tax=Saccostrea cuccullata TaxID=36930 RepID=UPI002ED62EEF